MPDELASVSSMKGAAGSGKTRTGVEVKRRRSSSNATWHWSVQCVFSQLADEVVWLFLQNLQVQGIAVHRVCMSGLAKWQPCWSFLGQ